MLIFPEQQFGPSEGQRQVKFCFDDSKWRDYPNERQLSKPRPSLYPSVSLGLFFYSTQRSCSTISGHSSYSLLDSTCTHSFLLSSFLIMFSSPSSSQPFIPLSLTFALISPSSPSPVKTHPFLVFFSFTIPAASLFTSLSSLLKGVINRTGHKGPL